MRRETGDSSSGGPDLLEIETVLTAASTPTVSPSTLAASLSSREIRRLRPNVDRPRSGRLLGAVAERERRREGGDEAAWTFFLAGAECPFTCVFCDLWRHTLDGPTTVGSIPAQLDEGLAKLRVAGVDPATTTLKLYNASNFFDPRAVPVSDDEAILERLRGFRRVVVENHPRFVGPRLLEFARALPGQLEVAVGLETIHPRVFPQLSKGFDLSLFERAAATLRAADIDLRVFLLVGLPDLTPAESAEWAVRSARWAAERGAAHVSLIPTRSGNGTLDELARQGRFAEPRLGDLEAALAGVFADLEDWSQGQNDSTQQHPPVVTADLWDLERFSHCPECLDDRRLRLETMNLTGRGLAPVQCSVCGGS